MRWIRLLALCACMACGTSSTATPAPSGTVEAGTEKAAGVYTCPTHPEVSSDLAGKCPKCGMDLVRRETVRSQP